ncbi:MAG TPA: imidazolonepropionase [Steroidobacteraceae bacterium]|nr:imidazolonepropionase [Steroidobacteraceae bacterium]
MAVSYVVEKFSDNWDRAWIGANVATMLGAAPYGSIQDAALAVKGERIAWLGSAEEGRRIAEARGVPISDVRGQWITPGLIDCHTHLVYGGNRVAEFEQRLCGASYEEIARAGGGIQSTMRETRAATKESLYESALTRLRCLMAEGVTTIEIKSGYGLELAAERRSLEVAQQLGASLPISVKKTFLGLHSLPPEFTGHRQRFVDEVSGPWLNALAAAGLVDAVDSFCENIAFSVPETEQFLRAAKKLALGAHVHAGQLSEMGAALVAAKCGALSADHLEFVSADGVRAMAAAGTVAVLLPTAYFTLRQTTPPPVEMLRSAGVPLAVATDSNPGTSPCTSILLALSMACTLFGLTPEEALAGVTREAARALGVSDEVGTIEVGKRADLAFWRIGRPAELCYGLGGNPLAAVMYRGKIRATAGA